MSSLSAAASSTPGVDDDGHRSSGKTLGALRPDLAVASGEIAQPRPARGDERLEGIIWRLSGQLLGDEVSDQLLSLDPASRCLSGEAFGQFRGQVYRQVTIISVERVCRERRRLLTPQRSVRRLLVSEKSQANPPPGGDLLLAKRGTMDGGGRRWKRCPVHRVCGDCDGRLRMAADVPWCQQNTQDKFSDIAVVPLSADGLQLGANATIVTYRSNVANSPGVTSAPPGVNVQVENPQAQADQAPVDAPDGQTLTIDLYALVRDLQPVRPIPHGQDLLRGRPRAV